MSALKITRGLPASGKTTWAKQWVAEAPDTRARANRDDLRMALFGKEAGLTSEQEHTITKVQLSLAEQLLRAGKDVVSDDTNLRSQYVRRWAKFARDHGVEFEVKEFEISIEESKDRNRTRALFDERWVPMRAIEDMRKFLGKDGSLQPVDLSDIQPYPKVEPYVPDTSKPPAVIVDLDGTLALHTSGRNPYDMTRVREDTPNWPVVAAVKAMGLTGHRVIFMSAREDVAREDTTKWLMNVFPVGTRSPLSLFMRVTGDHRKDAIVKAELFDKYVRHDYNVIAAFDDRNQVVEMWRSLGLTCLQVADGDF